MQIVKYETEQEAQAIIADMTAQGFTLVNVSNVKEGNFLGFYRGTLPQPTPLEQRLENIETTSDIILLKLEGII